MDNVIYVNFRKEEEEGLNPLPPAEEQKFNARRTRAKEFLSKEENVLKFFALFKDDIEGLLVEILSMAEDNEELREVYLPYLQEIGLSI